MKTYTVSIKIKILQEKLYMLTSVQQGAQNSDKRVISMVGISTIPSTDLMQKENKC